MNNRILITGVAGLIGSHLSRYLLDNGYDVFGIDNLSGGYYEFIDERLKKNFSNIDLNDIDKLNHIFEKFKPNYVFHLAAYAAEGLSPFIRNFNYKNNLICSINIINNCIKYDVKKIIFTSSMAVYGKGEPPFNEKQIPHPEDPYGIAKYAVEMDLRQAKEQFNLNYSIVRPHNVVGIYQNIWDKYRNVIGIWINNVINDKPITVYGDGKQKRAFSDIQFYMKPFERLINEYDNEIFNIGSDKEFEIIHVANVVKIISEKYGYVPKIEFLEERKEVKDAFCDHSKAKNLLNFSDRTVIENVIDKMFLWAMKEPKREIKYMEYEIQNGIYSFWKKNE